MMAAHFFGFLVIISRFYSGFCTETQSFLKTTTPNITAQIGANVSLNCFVYHWIVKIAFTFVEWKLNDREISYTKRIKQENDYFGTSGDFTLRIANVTTKDSGVYTCAVYFVDIELPPVKMELVVNADEPTILPWEQKTENVSLPPTKNMSAHPPATTAAINSELVTPTGHHLQTDKSLGSTITTRKFNTERVISKITRSTPKLKVVVLILAATLGAIVTACIVFVVWKRTKKGSRKGCVLSSGRV